MIVEYFKFPEVNEHTYLARRVTSIRERLEKIITLTSNSIDWLWYACGLRGDINVFDRTQFKLRSVIDREIYDKVLNTAFDCKNLVHVLQHYDFEETHNKLKYRAEYEVLNASESVNRYLPLLAGDYKVSRSKNIEKLLKRMPSEYNRPNYLIYEEVAEDMFTYNSVLNITQFFGIKIDTELIRRFRNIVHHLYDMLFYHHLTLNSFRSQHIEQFNDAAMATVIAQLLFEVESRLPIVKA